MPTGTVNAEMQERCCVQLSTSVPLAAIGSEVARATAYFSDRAMSHPQESANALAWRVVVADPKDDRLCAWKLFHGVLSATAAQQRAAQRERAKQLSSGSNGINGDAAHHAAEGEDGVAAASAADGTKKTLPAVSTATKRALEFFHKLVDYLPHLVQFCWEERDARAARDGAAVEAYRAMRHEWQELLTPGTYRAVAANLSAIAPAKKPACLEVHPVFVDALWKLRRDKPRVSMCTYLMRVFKIQPGEAELAMKKRSTTDATQPKVYEWVAALHQQGYCAECDTFMHRVDVCPCREDHVDNLPRPDRVAAVELLRNISIECLRAPNYGRELVLDRVSSCMTRGMPYEATLGAFDALRKRVTPGSVRRALLLMSSYGLLPSRVVFSTEVEPREGMPNGECTVTFAKLAAFLQNKRRIAELTALTRAYETLVAEFHGVLPTRFEELLQHAKATKQFIFTPFGLSARLAPTKTVRNRRREEGTSTAVAEMLSAKEQTRVWLEYYSPVREFAHLVPLLCRCCLRAAGCDCTSTLDSVREVTPHDLVVAEHILSKLPDSSFDIRDRPERAKDKLADICTKQPNVVAATGCHRGHVECAYYAVFDDIYGEIEYCRVCTCFGHDSKSCPRVARQAFERHHLSAIVAKLDFDYVRAKVKQLEAQGAAEEAEAATAADPTDVPRSTARRDAQDLLAAAQLYRDTPPTYPRAAAAALKALVADDSPVTLRAARYCPSLAEDVARSAKRPDLLKHIALVATDAFPDVRMSPHAVWSPADAAFSSAAAVLLGVDADVAQLFSYLDEHSIGVVEYATSASAQAQDMAVALRNPVSTAPAQVLTASMAFEAYLEAMRRDLLERMRDTGRRGVVVVAARDEHGHELGRSSSLLDGATFSQSQRPVQPAPRATSHISQRSGVTGVTGLTGVTAVTGVSAVTGASGVSAVDAITGAIADDADLSALSTSHLVNALARVAPDLTEPALYELIVRGGDDSGPAAVLEAEAEGDDALRGAHRRAELLEHLRARTAASTDELAAVADMLQVAPPREKQHRSESSSTSSPRRMSASPQRD